MTVYNTLTRKSEPFEPRDPGRVTMYVCGPTVYNLIHIGNARTFIWFGFIRDYLSYRGYDVTLVMNYTDVDDKIIERANLENLPAEAITSKYSQAFEEDMAALGARPPDILCRATDHIDDMVKAIEGLIERGAAYEADGNVWFAIENFPGYGKLSGRTIEDMRAGERIEPHESKRHPLDFSLWKAAKVGEPSWPSPWGPGRPGWHIECSVMSTKYLGMSFDVHGGASDLIFPHHENEIAQAEALEEKGPFVRNWLHAGLVQMEAEKMSKSLGNIVLARDAVEGYGREPVRYWMLMGTYRTQAVFSEEALEDARNGYERWRTFLHSVRHVLGDKAPERPTKPLRSVDGDDIEATGYIQRFIAAMDDDFNSAEAFAVIHELVREGNKVLDSIHSGDKSRSDELVGLTRDFLEMTTVLGFGFEHEAGSSELVEGLVEYLLQLREDARREKAFERADAIRSTLGELGVVVEDTPAGARWRIGDGSS